MTSTPLWQTFNHPFVKDLAFSLACPTVLNHWHNIDPYQISPSITVHQIQFWQQQFYHYQPRLYELDTTTQYQRLTRFLMSRPSPHRLGFHFEGLLHFWLVDGFEQGLHQLQLLAHNIQLYRDKQTVGELDFIIHNHQTGNIEHWELAVKFFLGSPPYDYANWVGINSKDTLHRKMLHMQQKPFHSVWVNVNLDGNEQKLRIDKRLAVIKGRFFVPNHTTSFKRPDWLSPSFPLHSWYDGHDKQQLAGLDFQQIRPAHYVEWFTKRDFYDDRTLKITMPKSDCSLANGLYFWQDKPLVIYTK
ncbi:DUF1853 family protein [Psychrobacter sp. I-STPA6b]|uniref:DUF1853 family protein n=1 Tax=Psychrobacter sp. I-STPA6b TaxID=2585718 RepID=UPI001D0C948D|nr:DUF1853 family protein [Psychrobacter sp. I-STPA6b]